MIKSLIEGWVEYNESLVLIIVDYEKAFDPIDQHKLLLELAGYRIVHRYITLIKNIYDSGSTHVLIIILDKIYQASRQIGLKIIYQ